MQISLPLFYYYRYFADNVHSSLFRINFAYVGHEVNAGFRGYSQRIGKVLVRPVIGLTTSIVCYRIPYFFPALFIRHFRYDVAVADLGIFKRFISSQSSRVRYLLINDWSLSTSLTSNISSDHLHIFSSGLQIF